MGVFYEIDFSSTDHRGLLRSHYRMDFTRYTPKPTSCMSDELLARSMLTRMCMNPDKAFPLN